MTTEELHWLAGLLEGEGSFLKGPPSSPNQPRIGIQMTDYDIIWRVSKMFGVKYVQPRRYEKNGWKQCYCAVLRGSKAVDLMKRLRPLMGSRRKKQIDNALNGYKARKSGDNKRKLNWDKVSDIAWALKMGESPASLARKFKVSHFTIRQIRDNKMWKGAIAA